MTPTPRQLANLKTLRNRSPEERKRIQSAGGRRHAELYGKNNAFEENLRTILRTPMKSGKIDDIADFDYIDKEKLEESNLTIQQKILLKIVNEALKGNIKATEFIFKVLGEYPAEKQQINATVQIDDNKDIVRIAKLMESDEDFKKKLLGE